MTAQASRTSNRCVQRMRLANSHQPAKATGTIIEPKYVIMNGAIVPDATRPGTVRRSQYRTTRTTPGHRRGRGSAGGGGRARPAGAAGGGGAAGDGAGGGGGVGSGGGHAR